MKKTSLSAGEIVRSVLLENEEITARTSRIFPVATPDPSAARMPYMVYARTALTTTSVKTGEPSDKISMTIYVFTEDYDSGVELAELVRGTLDHKQSRTRGVRSSTLVGGDESYDLEANAYRQSLTFEFQINKNNNS